jgi:hypothetical protein
MNDNGIKAPEIVAAEATAARNDKIVTLYARGLSSHAIAREVGLSYQGVLNILRRRGVPPRPRGYPPREQMSLARRIAQIACMPAIEQGGLAPTPSALYALCNDGSVWAISDATADTWLRLKDIPQDGAA